MGFIQLKLPKRLKLKLPNTSSLRKAREEYRQWLKERGLDKLKPRKSTGTFKFDPGEERTGVPLGNKIPVSGGKKKEPLFYSGKRKLVGIATMHKSNQVPVFADDDDVAGRKAATEITLMKGNK